MIYDYSGLASTAVRLLERFGRAATLRAKIAGGTPYDPTFTYQDSGVKAVFTGYASRDIDGTIIKKNDIKIVIDGAVAPTIGGQIIDGSDVYEIINFKTVKPGDTVIAYFVQGRK